MDTENTPAALAELREVVDRGNDRRSPLFCWMLREYEGLAPLLIGTHPNWARIAEILAKYGFAQENGEPLKKDTVRILWGRVRSRHAKLGKSASVSPTAATKTVTNDVRVPAVAKSTSNSVMSPMEALAEMDAEMNKRSGRG